MTAVLLFLKMTAWPLIKAYWKPIAIVLAVGIFTLWVYQSGVSSGREACQADYKLMEQQRDKVINDLKDQVAKGSVDIANNNKIVVGTINKRIAELSNNLKGPLVIVDKGDCTPSKEYIDAINAMHGAANEKN